MNEPDWRELAYIDLDRLRSLLHELTPTQIRQLPVEKLPDRIPEDIVAQAPFPVRGAVEALILEANAYHLSLRGRLQQALGEEGMAALDQAHHAGDTANVRIFRSKLIELHQARQRQVRDGGEPDLVPFAAQIKRLGDLLIDVRSEQVATRRLRRHLKTVLPAEAALRKPILRALEKLEQADAGMERLLGHFYALRLQLARQEMLGKRRQMEAMAEKRAQLLTRLEALQQERAVLVPKNALSRLLQRRRNDQARHAVEERILGCVTALKMTEVAVLEDDLMAWLDAVVDASLHPHTRERLRVLLTKARAMLFILLNAYCQSQEEGARQIAANPFIQVEPGQAIQYLIKSEEFILRYFARKREQASAWMSRAAENRMGELDALEQQLIQELRRSARR